jgi:hypothetical protein
MSDHYATLGVPRTASHEQIRRAYRERMRAAHPDASGGRQAGELRQMGSAAPKSATAQSAAAQSAAAQSAAAEVTRIAEAWNVLSSPSRRAAYDLQLGNSSPTRTVPDPNLDRVYPPARFPWRFVLTIIGVGAAILIVLHLLGDPMPERGIDGLISSGSCIDFDEVGAAFEVPCNGPHQAVVRELVPFDSPCDSDTTQARDRQGMGTVCIEP